MEFSDLAKQTLFSRKCSTEVCFMRARNLQNIGVDWSFLKSYPSNSVEILDAPFLLGFGSI